VRFLARRSTELELMDQPERVSREDLAGSLQGLRRVNRWLGGTRLSVRALAPLLVRASLGMGGPVRICDVGTGAADIPVALVRWARKRGISVHITAVELSEALADVARKAARPYPEIQVVQGDARALLKAAARGRESSRPEAGAGSLPAQAKPFDIVTANLFLHHFAEEEATAWLSLMDRASRHGVVVNDLERAFAPWLGIRAFGWVLSRNPVFLHDAPLSVRRAYTLEEWRRLARAAGLRRVQVRAHRPGRILLRNASSPT
jgi:ubiquinone/menaquinone biosynthesis C-methylase UbiE